MPASWLQFLQHHYLYQPRIRNLLSSNENKRAPLFDSVFFEVRTRCNGSCSFCAASIRNEIRDDKSMALDFYQKVIEQLKTLDYQGRIAYHVNNDPLLFQPLPEFVNIARKNLPYAWIQILTNGKALTLEKAHVLLKAGINELSVNVYQDSLQSPLPKIFNEIQNGLLPQFFPKSHIQTGHGPDPKEPGIFRFNIYRRKVNEILNSRAGTAPNKKEPVPLPRGFCEFPFTQFNISVDGSVSKCCADFYFSEPMGNLNHHSILEIWEGAIFQKVRSSLLQGNRSGMPTCAKCDYLGVRKVYSLTGQVVKTLSNP